VPDMPKRVPGTAIRTRCRLGPIRISDEDTRRERCLKSTIAFSDKLSGSVRVGIELAACAATAQGIIASQVVGRYVHASLIAEQFVE
jgi:hypothetical protein